MRAMSPAVSLSPKRISSPKSAMGWPPRRLMATSKETRVRLLGRWKISTRLRPCSGDPRSSPLLACRATSSSASISPRRRSAMLRRSRPESAADMVQGQYMSVRRIRPTHAAAVLGVPGPLGLGDVNIVVVVAGGLTETLQAAPLLAALSTATDEPLLFACAPAAADVARGLAGADEVLPVPGLAAGAGPAG